MLPEPELMGQLPADTELGTVTTDRAYETRKCHDAIADRGAHAVIPPRKNANPWKPSTAGAIARNEALRASKYLGRAVWRKWREYRRRSRAETKLHCLKLLGQSLLARDFDRQVAEKPDPRRRDERLHRARHTYHGARGKSASWERGTLCLTRFVQQSP